MTVRRASGAQEWPQRTVKLVVGFGRRRRHRHRRRASSRIRCRKNSGSRSSSRTSRAPAARSRATRSPRADKDGYTLVMIGERPRHRRGDEQVAALRHAQSVRAGGAGRDRRPVIVAHPDFPAKQREGIGRAAKADPGKVTFASVGLGSTQHFTGELFRQMANVDMLHVPFRGSPAAITAVLGKQVDVLFETVPAVLGQVQSGELKALAVTGSERFPAVPDVPTGIEFGVLPRLRNHHLVRRRWRRTGRPPRSSPSSTRRSTRRWRPRRAGAPDQGGRGREGLQPAGFRPRTWRANSPAGTRCASWPASRSSSGAGTAARSPRGFQRVDLQCSR